MGDSRAQGKHAGLTRKQVLETAVRLVDQEGAAALSMRKLARALNVEAMTLYHHVRSKRALEDAIVEHVFTEGINSPNASATWQEVLVGYADDLNRALAAHPGAVILFATRPAITTRSLIKLEELLRVLHGAGFAPRTALYMAYAVAGAVVNQYLAYAASRSDEAGQTEQPAEPGAVAELAGEELPLLTEAFGEGPATYDSRLEFTVNALVVGFAAHLD